MSPRLPVVVRIAAVSIAMLLTGCGWTSREAEPLRIGINAWPGYEFLYLAEQKGHFHDAGVNVRLIEFSSLSDARRAYERGQIDGLACTLVELVEAAHNTPRQPLAVLVTDYSDGGDVILMHATDDASSLRGKRIGVEVASLGIYILARALEKEGLTLQDVDYVATDQLSMAAAFSSGDLDAVVTYPPTSHRLLESHEARVVFSSADIPHEIIDVIAIDKTFVDQRRPDVQRFIDAYYRAMADHARDPAEAAAIMGRREGVSGAAFAASLSDGIQLVPRSSQIAYFGDQGHLHRMLPRIEALMRDSGQISGSSVEKPHLAVELWRRGPS